MCLIVNGTHYPLLIHNRLTLTQQRITMSISISNINLGTYANDGTGDDLRTAFEKVNSNFTQIGASSIIDAENLGAGVPVASNKTSNSLRFRSLRSISNALHINLSDTSEEILFATTTSVQDDSTPKLGGDLSLNQHNIVGNGNIALTGNIRIYDTETTKSSISASVFIGEVDGTITRIDNHVLSDLYDVSNSSPLQGQILTWDNNEWTPTTIPMVTSVTAGANIAVSPKSGTGNVIVSLSPNIDFGLFTSATNSLELLMQATPVDFGTFLSPSSVNLDLGTFAL